MSEGAFITNKRFALGIVDFLDLDLVDFAAASMVVSRAAFTTSNLNSKEYAKRIADMITVMTEKIAREKSS